MAKKRGYSREFTPQTERRVRFEVDRIPPTLYERVVAKAKRNGLSLRALTLTLWREWLERHDEEGTSREPGAVPPSKSRKRITPVVRGATDPSKE